MGIANITKLSKLGSVRARTSSKLGQMTWNDTIGYRCTTIHLQADIIKFITSHTVITNYKHIPYNVIQLAFVCCALWSGKFSPENA